MPENGIALRPYQAERFIQPIRASYAAGHKSVLAILPTGGGKTVCFSAMAKAAAEKGNTVGIVAHRIEIIDQISRTLDQFGILHGFIAPGRMVDPFAKVQVCSVQTMAKRIERIHANPFDFLIVDEAHHCAAGSSWHQIAGLHIRAGKRVLGVTATPRRLSGEPLADAFQDMVIGPTTAELIALGALSRYRAFAPVTPDMKGVRRRGGDFAREENEQRMDQPTVTGDVVREYRKRVMGKRALVFCVSVAHAEHVAAQFVANGITAESIDGKMDRTTRRNVLARFERGETHVLTSADLVSEGFDVPAIEAAFLLRPTESLSLYLQQVGRALRPFLGKEHAIICDHAGNIARHGLPDEDREWTLEGVKAGDRKTNEPAIATRTCASCFGVFRPVTACPFCGHEVQAEGRTIKEVEGELEELDLEFQRRARADEKARTAGERVLAVQRARTVADLATVAVANGYKPGWIGNMLKARGEKVPHLNIINAAMAAARMAA